MQQHESSALRALSRARPTCSNLFEAGGPHATTFVSPPISPTPPQRLSFVGDNSRSERACTSPSLEKLRAGVFAFHLNYKRKKSCPRWLLPHRTAAHHHHSRLPSHKPNSLQGCCRSQPCPFGHGLRQKEGPQARGDLRGCEEQ